MELGTEKNTRCHKIIAAPEKIEQLLLTMGVRCLPKHSREIILDLDAMGHILYGSQEGRFYSGYYGEYC